MSVHCQLNHIIEKTEKAIYYKLKYSSMNMHLICRKILKTTIYDQLQLCIPLVDSGTTREMSSETSYMDTTQKMGKYFPQLGFFTYN